MKSAPNEKEMIFFIVLIMLLILVLVLSGLFYFSIITGNSVSTGHVVLRHETGDQMDSSGLTKNVVLLGELENRFLNVG